MTEDIYQRLQRLKAKQERGEELTDEEIAQLQSDIENIEHTLSSFVDHFYDEIIPMMAEMAKSMEPLAEMASELQEED